MPPLPPRYRVSRAALQTLAVQQACPLSSRLSPENLWQPRWSAGKVGLPCFASFEVRQQPRFPETQDKFSTPARPTALPWLVLPSAPRVSLRHGLLPGAVSRGLSHL